MRRGTPGSQPWLPALAAGGPGGSSVEVWTLLELPVGQVLLEASVSPGGRPRELPAGKDRAAGEAGTWRPSHPRPGCPPPRQERTLPPPRREALPV